MAEDEDKPVGEEAGNVSPLKRHGEKSLEAQRAQEKIFDVGEGKVTGEDLALSPEEAKARRKRNIAIAFGVLGFIVIVYLTTILRYAANIEAGR